MRPLLSHIFAPRVPLTPPTTTPNALPIGGPARHQGPRSGEEMVMPRIHKAPSNVANIGNEVYDSLLLKEKSKLRPPVIEPLEVEVKPPRRPGHSVYAGALSMDA